MISYTSLFDESVFSENSYAKLAVLEECQTAFNEGIFDSRVVSTATSYTYSMVMELLENVKEKLLKLASTVLSLLNNYILNSAKYIDKYREILKDKVASLEDPFVYSYYKYPDNKDYPVLINASSIEGDIKKLQDAIQAGKWNSERVETSVNHMLIDFADKTISGSIDPYNIKRSVSEIVTKRVRGDIDVRVLSKEDIDQFITDFKTYKPHMDDIKRTKTAIEKEYKLLRQTYAKAIEVPIEIKGITNMQMIYDPDAAAMKAREQNRFADINVQMTRLFTGFIDIYNTSFNTKLNLIKDRIDINRHVIHELLLRTGLVAALNTKNPDKNKKPFKYEPSIQT